MANYFRTDGWVKSSLGPAIPGAQIYVCTQPANIASVPPSPLAAIFSDPNGLVPISLPIITDGFGHYDFYTTPGVYTLVVGLGGVVQTVYPDQSVGGFGSGGSLILQANGVAVADQLLLNFVGSGNVSVVDAGSGTLQIVGSVFQTNGTPNASQSVLNFVNTPSITWTSSGGDVSAVSASSYISSKWSLWTPSSGAASFAWDFVNDYVLANDNGGSASFVAPSATSNYAFTLTSNRAYFGLPWVYGGRNFTFNTTAIGGGAAPSLLGAYFILGVTDEVGLQTMPNLNSSLLSGSFAVFYKAVNDLVWSCVVGNGASITGFTTAISVSARHALEIDYTPTAAIFKIDGAVVATLTTHLPTTGVMFPLDVSCYFSSNGQTLTSEYIFIQNNMA